jgi:hypothetical protein
MLQKKEIGKRRKPEDQNASKKNKEKKVRGSTKLHGSQALNLESLFDSVDSS